MDPTTLLTSVAMLAGADVGTAAPRATGTAAAGVATIEIISCTAVFTPDMTSGASFARAVSTPVGLVDDDSGVDRVGGVAGFTVPTWPCAGAFRDADGMAFAMSSADTTGSSSEEWAPPELDTVTPGDTSVVVTEPELASMSW